MDFFQIFDDGCSIHKAKAQCNTTVPHLPLISEKTGNETGWSGFLYNENQSVQYKWTTKDSYSDGLDTAENGNVLLLCQNDCQKKSCRQGRLPDGAGPDSFERFQKPPFMDR